jgi:hypothetical protein
MQSHGVMTGAPQNQWLGINLMAPFWAPPGLIQYAKRTHSRSWERLRDKRKAAKEAAKR